jgi:hypothetical protein
LAIPIFMFDLHIAASSRRALSSCIDMLGIFERGGRNYSGKVNCKYCCFWPAYAKLTKLGDCDACLKPCFSV